MAALPVTLQQPAAETVVTGSKRELHPTTACSRDCGHRQQERTAPYNSLQQRLWSQAARENCTLQQPAAETVVTGSKRALPVTLQQPAAETVVTGSKRELPVTLQQPAAETVVTGSKRALPVTLQQPAAETVVTGSKRELPVTLQQPAAETVYTAVVKITVCKCN